jgi:hypothetical protein
MRMIHPEKTGAKGWLRDFRRSLMHEMIGRLRDYQHSLDPKKRDRWQAILKMQTSH